MIHACRTFLLRHAATAWWLVCAVALLATTWHFYVDMGVAANCSGREFYLKPAADVLVLLLPYWILPPRRRGSILIPLWGLSVLYFTDAVYRRFTSECMPLSLILQASNVDTPLLDSAFSLLRKADIIYLFFPAVATAAWCMRSIRRAVRSAAIHWSVRAAAAVVTALVFWKSQVYFSRAYSQVWHFFNGSRMSVAEATWRRTVDRSAEARCDHSFALYNSGVAVYIITELWDTLTYQSAITLTAGERAGFDAYLRRDAACDSLPQRHKNIVFVVVESLNAEAVGTHVGPEPVTPVLDSLIEASGTISSLNMAPQVGDGISSDGQLIYNLGTLPLLDGAATQSAIYGKRLPSLPAALAATHYPVAIFADRGLGWKKREAYPTYGYHRVLTSDSVATRFDLRAMGADDATMRYAVSLLPDLPQPFLLQILTISTHYAFGERAATDFRGGDISGIERDYLRCVRYADASIGRLIDGLRSQGLLDSTMLIIASDHHMNMDSGLSPARPIVFIAANCGHTERIEEPVHQADVFPTLLDLLGIHTAWRGVGHSMLGPRRGDSDPRQATVSDSVLRSDYFPLQ